MSIFGILAVITSLTVTLIGFPAQIIKNYKRKSCEGIAPLLIYCACLTYSLWTLYGWTKPDLFLIISQTSGCAFSFIVLFQLFYYARKETKMQCDKCGKEMKIEKLVPRMSQRVIGKQYFKMKCPSCGEIKYMKPTKVR